MDVPENNFDRLMFFAAARETSEANYERDPLDADNLTRWGGSLLELSQFQDGPECLMMVKEAILRLEKALEINPRKHDALWCLGNANTQHAFLSADQEMAKAYFSKATDCFQKAVDEDPENELYRKSLEVTEKFAQAPDLHMEIQRQAVSASPAAPASNTKGSKKKNKKKKKKSNDLTYDICGWVILAVGILTWVGMAKSHLPPPSSLT
ncbi:mitochondrial import receptor subunit TOM20-like [Wolffia australiana]